MRTKILLSAALVAAGIAAADAQQVYSVNAVGYVNVTLVPGYNLLANPLNGTNNAVTTILPTVPEGTSLLTWNPAINDFNQADAFVGGGWLDEFGNTSTRQLPPGQGFFLQNNSGANASITFVGEVPQGSLSNPVNTGYGFFGSQVPQSAGLTALGFPASEGMSYSPWDKAIQDYGQAYVFTGGSWFNPGGDPADPVLGVAEGFLLSNPNPPVNWTRNFSVNN
jgi:hypothetical protein